MFQVLSGDSWASAVARSIFAGKNNTEIDVAIFFVSFFLIGVCARARDVCVCLCSKLLCELLLDWCVFAGARVMRVCVCVCV